MVDNAIEAVCKVSRRWIKVRMRYHSDSFRITMSNTYNGVFSKEKGRYKTTKENTAQHGLGLKSIEYHVNKHDGYIKIHTDENIFTVDVFMYV